MKSLHAKHMEDYQMKTKKEMKHTPECLNARRELDEAPMLSGSSICICQKHTSTPWKLQQFIDHEKMNEICEIDGDNIQITQIKTPSHWPKESHDEARANAEFIIRAVNEYDSLKRSHAELLEAAIGGLAALEHVTNYTGSKTNEANNEIKILRTAIANAETIKFKN